MAEYLAALDEAAEPNPERKIPKVISPSDPCSAWTAKANKRVAEAGDVAPLALASKMANSIDVSAKLQDTYLPRRVAVIRQADDARRRGRRALRENE